MVRTMFKQRVHFYFLGHHLIFFSFNSRPPSSKWVMHDGSNFHSPHPLSWLLYYNNNNDNNNNWFIWKTWYKPKKIIIHVWVVLTSFILIDNTHSVFADRRVLLTCDKIRFLQSWLQIFLFFWDVLDRFEYSMGKVFDWLDVLNTLVQNQDIASLEKSSY